MKMTLRQFIEGSGIPQADTHYLKPSPERYDGYFNCVRDETYINRNVDGSLLARLRRKLYYDFRIGHIPLKPGTFNHRFLYWGSIQNDVSNHSLRSFFGQLGKVSEEGRFVVMIGGTDDAFTQQHVQMIPKSVKKIFAANCDVSHPKVQWYPIGRDFNNVDLFNIAPRKEKQELAYCNFSVGTHGIRKEIRDALLGKDFVNTVEIDGYGLYSGYPMTNERFVNELNNHAFSICPRGNGVDTFRMWESLHLGVVPIVVREARFQEDLSCLPILFLDAVDDFRDLTHGFLKKKHAEMMDVEYDFDMLRASYWNRLFRREFEEEG